MCLSVGCLYASCWCVFEGSVSVGSLYMCLVDFKLSYQAPGSPGVGWPGPPFSDLFSNRFLIGFRLVFGSLLNSIVDDFLCFWHRFFEYEICIDFVSMLGRILTSFSIVFWWISRSRIHLARSLAKLVFEQQYGVLRSKSRFYPFRKTWIFMIFLIFFDTSFGIDFWWVLASISAPFWEPFAIIFNVFRDRVLSDPLVVFLMENGSQKGANKLKMVLPFSSLFHSRSAGRVFEGSLAHFGLLLARCWCFLAPFSAPCPINVA